MPKTVFIINPRSNSSETSRRIEEIGEAILLQFPDAEILLTKEPGHATELSRNALKESANLVVAVGGDGTANEVMNGFFENGELVNSDAAFSVLVCGTGCDFRRTLEWPKDLNLELDKIKNGKTSFIDVGLVTYSQAEGCTRTRYFLNEASLGLSADVAKKVYDRKGNKNKLAYFIEALRSLRGHHAAAIRLVADGNSSNLQDVTFLVFANGAYFGGGMFIAPRANLADGLGEVVSFARINFWTFISRIHRLYLGSHLSMPQVTHFRAKKLEISGDERVLVETDGEPCGQLPCTFEILTRKLKLLH